MRLACRELLFELSHKVEISSQVEGLRLATMEDLHLIAPVHAAMAEAESGINPLEADREGFLSRCGRRITKDRVWVLVEDGELIFKGLMFRPRRQRSSTWRVFTLILGSEEQA